MNNLLSIVIPTYNRSRFLARVLRYYRTVRCPYEIVVADSSSGAECEANQNIVSSAQDILRVRYESYDSQIHLALKVVKVLEKMERPYAVLCGDDDFLVPKRLEQCVQFLETHSDYSIAHGQALVILSQSRPERTSPYSLRTYAYRQRSVTLEDPRLRLQNHLADYEPTFYSVHRRRQLIPNMQKVYEKSSGARFGELLLSCLSLIQGKSMCLEGLYMARQSIADSSARKAQTWLDLLESSQLASIYGPFRDCLAEELMRVTALSEDEAADDVNRAFLDYVKGVLRTSVIPKRGFSGNLVHIWSKRLEHSMRRIWQVAQILPSAAEEAFLGKQLVSMIQSPREAYHKLHRKRETRKSQDGMLIDRLLDGKSPYRADFLPIYESVWRYPEGGRVSAQKVETHS